MLFQCYNPWLVWNLRKLAKLAKYSSFWAASFFLRSNFYLDSGSTTLKDNELRHGVDVTSSSRNKTSLNFKKFAISNRTIQNGRPGRYRKSKRNTKKKPTKHPQPEREHPAIEVSPKSPCGAIPLGRHHS